MRFKDMNGKTKDCLKRVVGKNQSVRAIRGGQASLVYLAHDADPSLLSFIRELCEQHGVRCDSTNSLHQLGAVCGIDVGCAVCAFLGGPEK